MPDHAELQRIVEGAPPAAWLVVITKGGREYAVRDRLIAQDFEVYLPLRLLDPVKARKRGVAAVPFFPRFVFARATLDAYRWQAIFSTIGVQRVLCDPKCPKGLRPSFIDRVRGREIDGFLEAGLRDPNKPAPVAPPKKDPRTWVKLGDVVDGLFAEGVDEHRGSLLVSLLSEARTSIVQDIRRF